MKNILRASFFVFMILALTGCGDGGDSRPLIVTTIFSDPVFDGDIQKNPDTGGVIITQGMSPIVQSVFAGIDPVTEVESRAFLNFPLTGVDGVPGNAIIDSAFLDIFIDSIDSQQLAGTIPLLIDLVSFQPPNLVGTDFDRNLQPADFDLLPLATITLSLPISQAGRHISIDVTPLMEEAQRRGLLDFQLRIMMGGQGFVTPGVVEINDTTGDRAAFAPVLEVAYF